jgi:GT2 family glycosyltransferase
MNADWLISAALSRSVWGRFDVRIDGRHPMLRVVAAMMNGRSRLSGIATGDQAMFMTRSAFAAAGGFPGQPLMEDIELSRRLKKLGPPACIGTPVVTSGRRWERHGVWRTIFLMWQLRWAYWRGVAPAQLARRYDAPEREAGR